MIISFGAISSLNTYQKACIYNNCFYWACKRTVYGCGTVFVEFNVDVVKCESLMCHLGSNGRIRKFEDGQRVLKGVAHFMYGLPLGANFMGCRI